MGIALISAAALFADAASNATAIGAPIFGVALLGTMLKMLWDDRTRGQKIEATLRKQFLDERAARELEFIAEKAISKSDYQESLARHKDIHTREIAAFQDRITDYIEELGATKDRVSVLEAEVKELRAR